MIDPSLNARIRQRAYEIWVSEGRPEGRARIHWVRAEAEFRERLCGGRPTNLGGRVIWQKSYSPPAPPGRRDFNS
jgi:hypothetical protein